MAGRGKASNDERTMNLRTGCNHRCSGVAGNQLLDPQHTRRIIPLHADHLSAKQEQRTGTCSCLAASAPTSRQARSITSSTPSGSVRRPADGDGPGTHPQQQYHLPRMPPKSRVNTASAAACMRRRLIAATSTPNLIDLTGSSAPCRLLETIPLFQTQTG